MKGRNIAISRESISERCKDLFFCSARTFFFSFRDCFWVEVQVSLEVVV